MNLFDAVRDVNSKALKVAEDNLAAGVSNPAERKGFEELKEVAERGVRMVDELEKKEGGP